ncbi:hypothetical protein K8S19_09660 [bacterium]|nr:hypothetical protein [bacterium]
MKKTSIAAKNIYLRKTGVRDRLFAVSTTTSAATEGVHVKLSTSRSAAFSVKRSAKKRS